MTSSPAPQPPAPTDLTAEADLTVEAERLSVALGQMIRWLRREVPSELGPGSLAVLATLYRTGPLRLGELAAREGVSPPTLTRMVTALEKSGYLVRAADPHDRRATRAEVTPEGAEVVRRMIADRAAAIRSRLGELPGDVRQVVVASVPAFEAFVGEG